MNLERLLHSNIVVRTPGQESVLGAVIAVVEDGEPGNTFPFGLMVATPDATFVIALDEIVNVCGAYVHMAPDASLEGWCEYPRREIGETISELRSAGFYHRCAGCGLMTGPQTMRATFWRYDDSFAWQLREWRHIHC